MTSAKARMGHLLVVLVGILLTNGGVATDLSTTTPVVSPAPVAPSPNVVASPIPPSSSTPSPLPPVPPVPVIDNSPIIPTSPILPAVLPASPVIPTSPVITTSPDLPNSPVLPSSPATPSSPVIPTSPMLPASPSATNSPVPEVSPSPDLGGTAIPPGPPVDVIPLPGAPDPEAVAANTTKTNNAVKTAVQAAARDPASAFKQFTARLKRSYSPAESTQRQKIFTDNIGIITQLNSDSKYKGAAFGLTPFADWTLEEFKERMLINLPLPQEPSNGTMPGSNNTSSKPGGRKMLQTVDPSKLVPFPYLDVAPAASMDWRAAGMVTPVTDQSFCGSCTAFAATAAMESASILMNGVVPDFSEKEVMDCFGHPDFCNGGWSDWTFDHMISHGVAYETGSVKTNGFQPWPYPYDAIQSNTCPAEESSSRYIDKNILSQVTGYAIGTSTEDGLAQAVTVRPSVTYLCGAGTTAFQTYNGGILPCLTEDSSGCHAMLVVGYGTDPVEGDYWLCKNSWSKKWGEDGYVRIKKGCGSLSIPWASSPLLPVPSAYWNDAVKDVTKKYNNGYMGCFKDKLSSHTMKLVKSGITTRDGCHLLAGKKGYRFYALQNGNQCYGSNDISKIQKYGTSSKCSKTCDDGQQCGGKDANSVYEGTRRFILKAREGLKSDNPNTDNLVNNDYMLRLQSDGNLCVAQYFPSTKLVYNVRCTADVEVTEAGGPFYLYFTSTALVQMRNDGTVYSTVWTDQSVAAKTLELGSEGIVRIKDAAGKTVAVLFA